MKLKLDGFDADIQAMIGRLYSIDINAKQKCVEIVKEVVKQFKAEAYH
jgi:hypothetical protein